MRRADVMQAIASIVSFGKTVASSLGKSNSPELTVQVTGDDAPLPSASEWWGNPSVNCMPLPGGENLSIDLGGERVVFGAKERRWQVRIEQGECVVRALGPPPAAFIKLKPDGSIELHGLAIKLGGDAAVSSVALAQLVASAVNLALVGHTHVSASPGAPTGPGVVTVPVVAAAISSTVVKSL